MITTTGFFQRGHFGERILVLYFLNDSLVSQANWMTAILQSKGLISLLTINSHLMTLVEVNIIWMFNELWSSLPKSLIVNLVRLADIRESCGAVLFWASFLHAWISLLSALLVFQSISRGITFCILRLDRALADVSRGILPHQSYLNSHCIWVI